MAKYHGTLCKVCSGTLRYKKSYNCVACRKVYIAKWTRENRDKVRKAQRKYTEANRVGERERLRRLRQLVRHSAKYPNAF